MSESKTGDLAPTVVDQGSGPQVKFQKSSLPRFHNAVLVQKTGAVEDGVEVWRTVLYVAGEAAQNLTLDVKTTWWMLLDLPTGVGTPLDVLAAAIRNEISSGKQHPDAPVKVKGGDAT